MQNLLLHNQKSNTEKTQPLRLIPRLIFITTKFFTLIRLVFTLAWTNVYNPGEITYNANKDIANPSRLSDRLDPMLFQVAPEEGEFTQSGSFTGLMPYGINDGDILSIEIQIGFDPPIALDFYDKHGLEEMN